MGDKTMYRKPPREQIASTKKFLRKISLCICLPALMITSQVYSAELSGVTHLIKMEATNLPSGQLAYQMLSHRIKSKTGKIKDVTDRYSDKPSIPGPTIVMTEGDVTKITLQHGIADSTKPVSLHVHGVHYKIEDDGTVKAMNKVIDSAAFPGKPYTYTWTAAKGTAGTWPYHDHTFGNPMIGAEDKGLFGAVIVNPANGKVKALIDGEIVDVAIDAIDREFLLWMHETTFWGQEVTNLLDGKQTPLWTNPTIGARKDEKVRFHVIGMGTAFHTFHLHGHRWLDPGTTNIIDTVNIGPIYRHTFVIKAGEGVGTGHWHYHCHVIQHMQSGMMGSFLVVD
jgi:FtsP/CotA-like multicopper oxidase with cupredoxin domain